MTKNDLHQFIMNKLEDAKAKNITNINLKGKSSITDHMIICSGTSSRHCLAIAERLNQEAKHNNIFLFSQKTKSASDWIILDFGETLVHILQEESREIYDLETLWS